MAAPVLCSAADDLRERPTRADNLQCEFVLAGVYHHWVHLIVVGLDETNCPSSASEALLGFR